MKRGNRKRYLGYLLFALLFVLISYEFHSAANRASNLELPDAAANAVLRGVSEDEILPNQTSGKGIDPGRCRYWLGTLEQKRGKSSFYNAVCLHSVPFSLHNSDRFEPQKI